MRFTALLILLAASQAMAQRGDNWDFLSDPSVFRDVHGMLPAYLKAKAFAFLDERQQKVATDFDAGGPEDSSAVRPRAHSQLPGRAAGSHAAQSTRDWQPRSGQLPHREDHLREPRGILRHRESLPAEDG